MPIPQTIFFVDAFRGLWADKAVTYEEAFLTRNRGWLKNWDVHRVSKLSRDDFDTYNTIDFGQISDKFKFMRWKDYVEVIMELYSEYYEC